MISNFISQILFSLIAPGIIVGILCVFFSLFLPDKLMVYKTPTQLVGLILIVFSVFQYGRYIEVEKNKLAIAQRNLEISRLETKSEKINTQVVTEYVDKIKIVNKIKEVPVNVYITKEADIACRIDPRTSANIRGLLNSAASGQIPSTTNDVNGITN